MEDLYSYFGTRGRMIALRCPRDQAVSLDDNVTFRRTLEGRVKAQSPLEKRRRWDVKLTAATAVEVAAVYSFADGEWGKGPFLWFAADSTVTNMLSPDAASCRSASPSSVVVSGPMDLGDGTWAGRSVTNPVNAPTIYPSSSEYVPAVAGKKITASAYVLGEGGSVGISYYDSAGTYMSLVRSVERGNAATTKRLSVTSLPPVGAASAVLMLQGVTQYARPAITHSDILLPWSAGAGCFKAVMSGVSKSTDLAEGGPHYQNYSGVSFTITELG